MFFVNEKPVLVSILLNRNGQGFFLLFVYQILALIALIFSLVIVKHAGFTPKLRIKTK